MLRVLRSLRAVLALVAVVVAGAALWISVDNPTVDGTSRGTYTCLAPYDTVLDDAIDPVGGEPPPDDDEIAAVGVSVLLHRRDHRPVT